MYLELGEKSIYKKYRGTALLDTMYHVVTTIVRNRLQEFTDKELGEYQAGFRRGRCVTTKKYIQSHGMYDNTKKADSIGADDTT